MSNKNTKEVHSVKYNFVMNFILTASSFIFPLITFPYVSRILFAAGTGKVNFAASIANYFLMVASLGIPTYGVRACAKVRDDKDKLSKTAQEILIINSITTILVTVTYIICIFTVPKFSQDKTLYFIEGINIVLNMFGANWIYQALEKYDYITIRSIAFKAISIVLMFLLVHEQTDTNVYAFVSVFAAVGSNILNFLKLHEYIYFKKYSEYNFKQHFKPILVLFAQNVTISIYTNLDTVMLGFMKTDTDVGLYSAAVKVKGILVSLVTSFSNVLLPRMSYYVNQRNKDNFNKLMGLGFNTILLMSLPLATYFIFEAKDSILLLAGEDYYGAINAMRIITLTIIPIGFTGLIGIQVLTPLNKERYVLYSVIVGALTDLILNFFMIPLWGAAGAALATTIAEFLVLVVQVVLGYEIIKPVLKDIRFSRYLLFTMISLALTIAISFVLVTSSFLRLVMTAIVFFGTYAICLFIVKDELFMKILDNKIVHKFVH